MTQRPSPFRALAGTLLAVLTLVACTKDPKEATAEAVADGTAFKEVKALVDGRPQCARVMSGWEPIDMIDAEDVALPAMRALIDAGLLEPMPEQSTAERPVYRSTVAAQPFARKRPLNDEKVILDLCYGKRQVTRVWVEEKWTSSTVPYVQYAFRVVEPAPWVTPSMRQTFPFLDYVLNNELVSQDMLPVRDGKITMSLPMDDLQLPNDMIETFSLCPEGVANPVDRCRQVEEWRKEWRREQEERQRQTPAS